MKGRCDSCGCECEEDIRDLWDGCCCDICLADLEAEEYE
jgi:hypothetical protein